MAELRHAASYEMALLTLVQIRKIVDGDREAFCQLPKLL